MTVFANRNKEAGSSDSDIYIESDCGAIELYQRHSEPEARLQNHDFIYIGTRSDAEQLISKLRKLLDDKTFKFNTDEPS